MFWFTFWLIFFIIAGFATYFIIKSKTEETYRRLYTSESPLEILKRRLAKGEITEEEFERLKKDLES